MISSFDSLTEVTAVLGRLPADLAAPDLATVQAWVGASYQVDRFIGRGTLSFVYSLSTTTPPQRLALKLVPPAIAADPAFREHFLGVAPLLISRSHPNLASVHEARLTPDGHALLVQQWLEGESLAGLLARRRSLPIPVALNILRQLCDALCAAGTAHGDLQPGNIFLCRAQGAPAEGASDSDTPGSVKLLDFGLAPPLRVSGAPHLGLTPRLGRPAYLAPEQVHGAAATPHSDQFVLAAMFYEMVRGCPAFARPHDRPADTLQHILAEDPLPIALDKPLDAALRRALSKGPSLRFSSLEEFITNLCGEAAPRRPVRPQEPHRTGTSRRWMLASAAAALLLGGAAVAGYRRLARETPPKPPPAPAAAQASPATPAGDPARAATHVSLPPPAPIVAPLPVPIATPPPAPIVAPPPAPIVAPLPVPIATPPPAPIVAPPPAPIAAPSPAPIATPLPAARPRRAQSSALVFSDNLTQGQQASLAQCLKELPDRPAFKMEFFANIHDGPRPRDRWALTHPTFSICLKELPPQGWPAAFSVSRGGR